MVRRLFALALVVVTGFAAVAGAMAALLSGGPA